MTDDFSKWLRAALDDARMNQSELARRIGTSPSHVSRWVHGGCRPQARMRKKVESVLSTPRVPKALRAAYALRAKLSAEMVELEAELAMVEYEMRVVQRELAQ